VSVPADWVRVEVHCGYSFMAPPEVTAGATQGIDSCIDEWVTSGRMHRGDYGAFSSDLSEYAGQPQHVETRATSDGRSARLLAGSVATWLAARFCGPWRRSGTVDNVA
jgi:hypothetical protein